MESSIVVVNVISLRRDVIIVTANASTSIHHATRLILRPRHDNATRVCRSSSSSCAQEQTRRRQRRAIEHQDAALRKRAVTVFQHHARESPPPFIPQRMLVLSREKQILDGLRYLHERQEKLPPPSQVPSHLRQPHRRR